MPPLIMPLGDSRLDLGDGQFRDQPACRVQHAGHVGQHQQPRGAERAGDRTGTRVGVDVVGLAVRAAADRGDHRDQAGAGQRVDHADVDRVRLADEAQVQHALDVAAGSLSVRRSLRARIRPPSLPQMPTASAPARLISSATCLFTVPARTISTTSTMAASVTRRPSTKVDLDGEPLQHGVDLRAAAMHHHRVDADLLQDSDIATETLGEVAFLHGVTAVLHHHRGAGVAAQERQGIGEDARLFVGRDLGLLDHVAHAVPFARMVICGGGWRPRSSRRDAPQHVQQRRAGADAVMEAVERHVLIRGMVGGVRVAVGDGEVRAVP